MSRIRLALLALLLLGLPTAQAAPAPGTPAVLPTHAPGEVLVRFTSEEAREALQPSLAALAYRSGASGALGFHRVRFDPSIRVDEVIGWLQGLDGIALAQPNHLYRLMLDPDDPNFGQQWALENTGQTVTTANYATNNPGTPGADMGMPLAWETRTDCGAILVAVVDSGIDIDHPDLQGSLWDGGPAFPNHGYDFADDDLDPRPATGDDHGTHVAGTIGAAGNNALGVSGVCWQAQLMVLRAGNFLTGLLLSDVIDAIEFAVVHGADVINLSLGAEITSDPALGAAIDLARNAGVLVIAAAGNGGGDGLGDDIDQGGDDGNPATRFYPCAFPHDNVVCVAASDQAHFPATFSNTGTTSVDLAAPGTNILSTSLGTGYRVLSGTSMATAFSTGAAALLWSQNPAYGYADTRAALLAGGTPVPAWSGLTATGRVVSGNGAVRHLAAPTGLRATVVTP